MSNLLLAIWTYLVLQLMALAGWPWLAVVLRLRQRRPTDDAESAPDTFLPLDLAIPLAKSLGLVLVAYVTWLVAFVRVPAVGPTVWLVWALVGGIGWVVAGLRPRDVARRLYRHGRDILIIEAIVLTFFLSFCNVRARTPDATFRFDEHRRTYDGSGSEKFTNLALLTSLYRERYNPPRDTWLAGYPINYYYFGHYEWATFCKMAFLPPRVGFNFGQAAMFALVAANAFSLALLLTRQVVAGVLAAIAVTAMGSPYGLIHLLLAGAKNYRFWEASRIVEGTLVNGGPAGPITEFPCFTFIVGDFHAHGLSFHSLLLAVAIAFLLPVDTPAASTPEEKAGRFRSRFSSILVLLLLALLLAVTVMTNAWDAPSLGILLVAALTARLLWRRAGHDTSAWMAFIRSAGRAIGISLAVAGAALVLCLPFLATFELPVGAVRDPEAFYIPHTPIKWLGTSHLSEFKDYMVHFGFTLLPLTLLLHTRLIGQVRRAEGARRRRGTALLGATYLAALYVFLFAQRFFLLFYLAAMAGCAVGLILVERAAMQREAAAGRNDLSRAFLAAAALSAVAFFLSLFAEVWVIDDGYANEWERYNTVFKIYNVCWLVYGVCFAATAATWFLRLEDGPKSLTPGRLACSLAALVVWLGMGMAYWFAATAAREREHNNRLPERIGLPRGQVLDAVRYYASVNRDEYALIEWINENIKGKPIVAEGCVGESAYTLQSRIATFTGVRTVLAWPQHEANWRSQVASTLDPGKRVKIWREMSDRIRDLKDLYTSTDEKRIRAIIDRYRIDYIAVGRLERALYGSGSVLHLPKIYKPAFKSGETFLLKTERGESESRTRN